MVFVYFRWILAKTISVKEEANVYQMGKVDTPASVKMVRRANSATKVRAQCR